MFVRLGPAASGAKRAGVTSGPGAVHPAWHGNGGSAPGGCEARCYTCLLLRCSVRGCSSMAELLLPKQTARVRFPSAPPLLAHGTLPFAEHLP